MYKVLKYKANIGLSLVLCDNENKQLFEIPMKRRSQIWQKIVRLFQFLKKFKQYDLPALMSKLNKALSKPPCWRLHLMRKSHQNIRTEDENKTHSDFNVFNFKVLITGFPVCK